MQLAQSCLLGFEVIARQEHAIYSRLPALLMVISCFFASLSGLLQAAQFYGIFRCLLLCQSAIWCYVALRWPIDCARL
jgi:hypothetical protein